MKSLSAALILLLWSACAALGQSVGPTNQILCNLTAQATVATATTTPLVSGVAGKSIYLCGWHVTSTQSGSSTFQFEYGTQGGPCTTPTVLTPAFNVTNTAPSGDHIDWATITAPVGTQLCVVTTGATVGESVLIYYAQF